MRLLLLVLLVCVQTSVSAQTDSVVTIRGVVLDVLGKPLEGSTISLFGSENEGRTDGSGNFELQVAEAESSYSRLMVRHMGYSSVQVSLKEFQGTRHSISVMLSPKRKESRYVIR